MSPLHANPTLLSFLSAIKECPEDDTPRLILADWLDDNGDPYRAEFIRLECKLASKKVGQPGERAAAVERVEELLRRFGGAWAGPLWHRQGARHDWHRGMLCVQLGRRPEPEHLEDVLPWIDSAHFDVYGFRALDQAVQFLDTGGLNHAALTLHRAFRPTYLLERLGQVRESSALRTLTLWWARPAGRRKRQEAESGAVSGPDERFLATLLGDLPLGRHLTHLSVGPNAAPRMMNLVRAQGIKPVSAWNLQWTRQLPLGSLRPMERLPPR